MCSILLPSCTQATVQPATAPAFAVSAQPPADLENWFKAIPDRPQIDSRLPNRGRMHCGPTAVSGALMWFARNGFPELLSEAKDDDDDLQYAMIRRLEKMMRTDPVKGTGPNAFLDGVKAYVESCGLREYAIEFCGYRSTPAWCKPTGKYPTPQWLARMNEGTAVTWLHIAWYKPGPEGKGLVRSGGHWVTVIGVGRDAKGQEDAMCLTVVDPSNSTGTDWKKHTVRMVEMDDPALPGRYKLVGQIVRNNITLVMLDNAVGLRLER